MELIDFHGAPGVVVPLESPYVAAAERAIEHGFGRRPVFMREGGSIPVVGTFHELLGVDTLLLGWGLDDDNTHSPNEKFSPGRFPSRHQGQRLPVARTRHVRNSESNAAAASRSDAAAIALPRNQRTLCSTVDSSLKMPTEVELNCQRRGSRADVRQFVALEAERKRLQLEVDELNRRANEVSKSIGKAKDAGRARSSQERRPSPARANAAAQADFDRLAAESEAILRTIPNLSHPDAPLGADDQANLEIRRGKHAPPKFDFKPLDHVELGERLELIDFEAGAKVAGHGFYFLKNDAVLLELALQRYALDVLIAEGFTPTITPDLARNEILQGTGYIPRGPETQIYSIADSDLSLVATAEITLGGLLAGEILDAGRPADQALRHQPLLPHRGRRRRPRFARAVSRAPVHQGRDVRLHAARGQATRCSTTSASWSAGCSTAWASPTAWSTPPPATWAGRPIASSTWKPGCRAAAKRANMAK